MDHWSSLSVKLGGLSTISAAISEMWEHFITTPGCSDIFRGCPERISELSAFYVQQLPELFEAEPGSKDEEEMRIKIKQAHSGLLVLPSHFAFMSEQLRAACLNLDLTHAADAVLGRWEPLLQEVTGDSKAQVDRATLANTPSWRSDLFSSLQEQQLTLFAESLVCSIGEHRTLCKTPWNKLMASDVASHIRLYLAETDDCPQSVLPAPEGAELGGVTHLAFANVAWCAMVKAGWDSQASDILFLTIMAECDSAFEEGEQDLDELSWAS